MTSKWATAPLATVCEVKRGETITRTQTTTGMVPVIAGGLKPAYFHGMSNRPTGAITVSGSGANAGSVAMWEEEIWASDCSTVISKNPDLSQKFVFYFLKANETFIKTDLRQGAAQPHVYAKDLAVLEIPLPPLDEQKRIVAKLDKAFSEIEKLEKSVTNIKSQSSFFRTSIYDKYFNFPGTRKVKLGEIANFEGGQQPPKSEFIFEPKDGFVRFVQIRDFKSDKNIAYIPVSPRNRICKESDILIGRYGASVGQILTGLAGAYNVALMKLIPETNSFNPQYAFHYLQSFSFQSQLAKVSKRSAQAGFSKDDISSFLVPLPDLETQVSIVSEIESVNLLLDGYESRLNSKGQFLGDLYKSLLNSAFSGDF